MVNYPIPKPTEPVIDGTGLATRAWYNFFRARLSQSAGDEQIAELEARVAALEAGGVNSAQIVGVMSVVTNGQLSDGLVQVRLRGDESAPGGSRYYGTDPDGAKGWFVTPDGAIGATFDGGGEVLEVGSYCDVRTTYSGTITDAAVYVDPLGSVVIDVRKCASADYPPTAPDSIVGGSPPTVSADVSSIDTTLTGWTVDFANGDVLRFQITSVTDVEKAFVSLRTIK